MAGNWLFMDTLDTDPRQPEQKQLENLRDYIQNFANQMRHTVTHLTEKNFAGGVIPTGTVSDKRRKSGIRYDMERYRDFFRKLRPCVFRMKGQEAEGYHMGFIAQEVLAAAHEAGMTDKDVAAVFVTPGQEYRIRYEEFTALCCWMIQRMEERIEELEQRTEKKGRKTT